MSIAPSPFSLIADSAKAAEGKTPKTLRSPTSITFFRLQSRRLVMAIPPSQRNQDTDPPRVLTMLGMAVGNPYTNELVQCVANSRQPKTRNCGRKRVHPREQLSPGLRRN